MLFQLLSARRVELAIPVQFYNPGIRK